MVVRRSDRELREWIELLRQGTCPRRGRGVDSIHVLRPSGSVMAIHRLESGRVKACYIATLRRLKRAGMGVLDVLELRERLKSEGAQILAPNQDRSE